MDREEWEVVEAARGKLAVAEEGDGEAEVLEELAVTDSSSPDLATPEWEEIEDCGGLTGNVLDAGNFRPATVSGTEEVAEEEVAARSSSSSPLVTGTSGRVGSAEALESSVTGLILIEGERKRRKRN